MRISTQTLCLSDSHGDFETVRILAEAGFDSIDYSFLTLRSEKKLWWLEEDWRDYAIKLRQTAERYGVRFSQAHAPYWNVPFEMVLRSMEAASMLGASHIVVHPIQDVPYITNKKQLFERNVEYYKALLPYCEKWNIVVCVENMFQDDDRRRVIIDSICADPDEFRDLIDAVGSPWVRGCLDIGHCALTSRDPVDVLHTLGSDHIVALHVHDVDYLDDCHTLPFVSKLDWEPICQALADIGYQGEFTLEADFFIKPMPETLRPAASRFMAQTARYLADRVEAYRSEK